MQANLKNLVSITEANQNFSRIARLVDANGVAVIMKNNIPKYVLLDYRAIQEGNIADEATVEEVAKRYLKTHNK